MIIFQTVKIVVYFNSVHSKVTQKIVTYVSQQKQWVQLHVVSFCYNLLASWVLLLFYFLLFLFADSIIFSFFKTLITDGCDPGKFKVKVISSDGKNTTDECYLCPSGFYSAKQNARFCHECPLGFYANDILSSDNNIIFDRCSSCSRGTYGISLKANNLLEGCQNCTSGTYSDIEAAASIEGCKECPKGKWSSDVGMTKESGCVNCGTGKYGPDEVGADDEDSCKECSAGTFLERVGAFGSQSCHACPSGYAQKEDGQAFCLPCTPGSYASQERLSKCVPCAVGRASANISRSSPCDVCNRGLHQPKRGMTACLSCIPGRYQSKVEQVDCVDCVVGRASSLVARGSECEVCFAGRHQSESGMTACLSCTPGSFQDQKGQEICKECPENTKSEKANAVCVSCGAGEKSEHGSAKCQKCDAGQAGTGANGTCAPCHAGQYRTSDMDDATKCVPCGAGFYQSDTSQASCLPCIPGTYNDQQGLTACKNCAKNTFSSDRERKIPCSSCFSGRSADTGSVACSSCQPGQYISLSNTCETCPSGYVSNTANAPNCSLCSLGETATQGSALCLGCNLGKYGSSKGFCSDCPIGTFQDGRGKITCSGCARDTYSTESGKTSGADCESCPDKTTTNFTTGNTNIASCVCSAGFYFDPDEVSDEVSPEDKCTPCLEEEASCTDANVSLADMESSPGWWRQHKEDVNFFQCYDSKDCVGGRVGYQCRQGNGGVLCAVCNLNHVRIDGVCSQCGDTTTGFSGVLLLAGVPLLLLFIGVLAVICIAKEKENDDKVASPTGSSPSQTVIIPVTKLPKKKKSLKAGVKKINTIRALQGAIQTSETTSVVGAVLEDQLRGQLRLTGMIADATGDTTGGEITVENERTTSMQRHINAIRKPGGESLGNRIRILIGYIQITAALVFSFDVPWPPFTKALLLSLTFINFNFIVWVAPLDPCLLDTSFLDQCLFHMMVIPCCSVIILIASLLSRVCKKSSIVWPKAKSVLVSLVFLLYPGIVTRVFTFCKCKRIGDKSYLVADYNVVCWEGEHEFMSLIMFGCMGVYVIGIPLGSVLILYMNKCLLFPAEDADEELSTKSATFAEIYGALYLAYEPKYWYFEGIVMIQKALLTGGLVLVAPGSSAQILVGLVVALAFYTILLRTQPYEGDTEDNLQNIATASTVMTLLIGFALKLSSNSDHSEEYESLLMDGILIGLFAGVGVTGFYMTLTAMPCFGGDEEEEEEEEENENKMKKEEEVFKTTDNRRSKHLDASFTRDSVLMGMRGSQMQPVLKRLRDSTLAKMRISELTLVHEKHQNDPETQKRIASYAASAKLRISELTLVHAKHQNDPETQKRIAAYAASATEGRSSSLGPPLPVGPPPTLPPRHSATPKILSGIRESKARSNANVRIKHITNDVE